MSRGLPSPSSLRIALVDSCLLAATLAAAGLAMTALTALSAEPIVDQQKDEAAEKDLKDRDIKLVGPESDLHPTPQYDESDKTQALLLGMKLELTDDKQVVVTEVSATSPAWKAGVRRGDTVMAVSGVRPTDLGMWLRDVTKIVKEKQPGQEVSIDVVRNGAKMPLQIRVPESRVAEVLEARREMKENLAQLAGAPATVPSSPNLQPDQSGVAGEGLVPAGAAGYGGLYGGGGFNWGVFGDEGGAAAAGANDRMANRAIAQLFAAGVIGNGPTANKAGAAQQDPRTAAAGQANAGQTAGGAVGVAAFQNRGQGVAAVVEVRGLPAGSYLAGVSESGEMAGVGSNPFQNLPKDGQLDRNNPQQPAQPANQQNLQRGNTNPNVPVDRNRVPSPNPGTGSSLADPSGAAVLAQRLDAQPSSVAGGGGAAPANAGAQQQPNPNADPRAARPGVRQDARTADPSLVGNEPGNRNGSVPFPSGNAGLPQFVAQLGTLHVGPDGTGRVQQQLEGMQVENLAGLTVVIVSTTSQGGGGTALAPKAAVDPNANGNPNATRQPQAGNPASAGVDRNAATGQNAGNGVVATGVIRLANDPGLSSQQNQPNAADPNDADAAARARAQRQRFEGTSPTATFDPAQPQSQQK